MYMIAFLYMDIYSMAEGEFVIPLYGLMCQHIVKYLEQLWFYHL